jgi:hypothetical protein
LGGRDEDGVKGQEKGGSRRLLAQGSFDDAVQNGGQDREQDPGRATYSRERRKRGRKGMEQSRALVYPRYEAEGSNVA